MAGKNQAALAVCAQTKAMFPFTLGNDCIIQCEEKVKLLGVDFNLSFKCCISNICKKASRQLGVLKGIGKNLCKLGQIYGTPECLIRLLCMMISCL